MIDKNDLRILVAAINNVADELRKLRETKRHNLEVETRGCENCHVAAVIGSTKYNPKE